MKKMMALCLACLCCCLWIGGAFAAETEETITFPFEGAVVAFQGWHEDTSVLDPTFKAPAGRYVMVRLTVDEGELPWGPFTEDSSLFVLNTPQGEYLYVSAIAHGIKIGDDGLLAVGTIDFIYDLPQGEIPETFTLLLGEEPLEIPLGEAIEITK